MTSPTTAGQNVKGQRGLDWHNFFVANVQTGFGPFIAVYLATESWSQGQIGAALSVGTIAGMVSQLPGGALVDWLHNKRLAALAACIAICFSALILALWPVRLPVLAAEVLHGFASAMLPAAIAAMSLAFVGRAAFGERIGRNARFAALGNGVAAAVMGAVGTYVGEVEVFYLTAILMLPGIAALFCIPQNRVELPTPDAPTISAGWREAVGLLLGWRVLVFAAVVTLFHFGNAAMLPLVAGEVTTTLGSKASLVIAACIVLPQLLVAYASPHVGRLADRWGRRPVIVITFLAVPLRGALLALFGGGKFLPFIQMLDGISAAGFGVILPLMAADLTRGTERFTLCMGMFGLAAGLGATISTALAGHLADVYGNGIALWTLSAAALGSVLLAATVLPETRPARASPVPARIPA